MIEYPAATPKPIAVKTSVKTAAGRAVIARGLDLRRNLHRGRQIYGTRVCARLRFLSATLTTNILA
ncbi:hypothetical protein AGR1A_Lc100013 [Agrobacterium fabacearum CFBP 5771]|nr:hypothetical protein AGR1A_Lc100013 [Agrobacterium fabacearum CFBP 5771]